MVSTDLSKRIERWGRYRPHLYHMAYDENRDGIRRHGLLSTEALLDLVGATPQQRTKILSEHRPASVQMTNGNGEPVLIRDQKPINPEVLNRHLTDMTLSEWFETLNANVFFWAKRSRLNNMIACAEYCTRRTLVFKVSTVDLLKSHPCACVTTINTGNTKMMPVARGSDTFSPFRTYPHGIGRAVELVVPYSVADILDCTEEITVEQNGAVVDTIDPADF